MTRRLAATVVAALAFVLATAAGPANAAPRDFYGVVTQAGLAGSDYDLMRQAGVGTLRFQFGWPVVQASEGSCDETGATGTCDWSSYDRVVGEAAARGVQAFPYLMNVPDWISSDREEAPVHTEEARQAWSEFAAAAVARYGPGGVYWTTAFPTEHPSADPVPIEDWQVWNEPSATPFWHPKPNPREYGELVELTSRAITGVDPDAYIVLGGVFGTPIVEIGGIEMRKWIRKVYRTPGIERFFDAVAIHPYGPDIERVKTQVDWALAEMRKAGDRKADLWISEIGWASDHVHNQLGVGRKGQAKMLRKAYRMFARKRSDWNIESVDWYAWQDVDSEDYCDFCRRSGLVDVQQRPKPSFDAFRGVAEK
jgi:hypothetical protein